MKNSPFLPKAACALAATVLILAGSAPTAVAQGAVSLSLNNLISQGFTNIPYAGCVVTNVKWFPQFELRQIAGGEAKGGILSVYGLNFLVGSAKVEGEKLLVEGSLQLMQPPHWGDNKIPITADSATLQFNTNGFETVVGGTICYAAEDGLPLWKPLKIKGVCGGIVTGGEDLALNFTAKLAWAMGPGFDRCDPTNKAIPIDAEFGWEGGFKNFGVKGTGIRCPLGTAGALLDEINAKVGIEDGTWYISGGLVVHVGCPLKGGEAEIYAATMTADGKISGGWCVEINGAGKIFDIPVAGAHFIYNPPLDVSINTYVDFFKVYLANCDFESQEGNFSGEARGKLQIPPWIPLVGGWQVANTYAAVDNNGFQGSFTINVSPEIPPVCFDQFCPPTITLFWYPCGWWSMCRKTWTPPCTPAFCTPRIPPVTAHVGFQFRSGSFSWDEVADDKVEAWELSYRHVIRDAKTGNRMWFMSNYQRRDKTSTGSKGRPFNKDDGGNPVTTFIVPEGEENVIFRLTYQNTSAPRVAMGLQVPNGTMLDVNGGPLPNGFSPALIESANVSTGAYAEVLIRPASSNPPTPAFGEAYFSLPRPKAGEYTVVIYNDKALGNFAVEHLRQNIPPTLALNNVQTNGGNYRVNYNSTITEGTPTTRIYLCKMGDKGETKAGPRYLVGEFPSVSGTNNYTIPNLSTNVNPGLYRVGVTIADPQSRVVETISSEEVFVDNPLVPAPVTQMVTLARDQKFDIAWLPSTSSNVIAYMIRYTKSAQPTDFEYQKTVSFKASSTTVDGLVNGQPYLVTIVAISEDGYQSRIGPVTRVVPTEGFGLTLPAMFSPPDQIAVVASQYVYRPQIFWGDAEINQLLASALLPVDADQYFRQVIGFIESLTNVCLAPDLCFNVPFESPLDIPSNAVPAGFDIDGITNLANSLFTALPLHWDLVAPPSGMTIGAGGMVSWTPAATNIGDYLITIRTSLTNLDAGAIPKLSVLQTFPLSVVDAKYKNTSGLKAEAQGLFSDPITKAFASRIYAYLPVLTSNTYNITLLEGPPGMTIKQVPDPRTISILPTNYYAYPISVPGFRIIFDKLDIVYWDVPANATDQRVRLRAVPRNLPNPTEEDYVYQAYYLSVVTPTTLSPPQPLEITRFERSTDGVGLVWSGPNGSFLIQRSVDLSTWQQIGTFDGVQVPTPLGTLNLPVGSGSYLDRSPPAGKAFYRIKRQ